MGPHNSRRFRPHLQVIALLGVIVPKRLRADWRREWQGELEHRELLLAEWDRLSFRQRCNLLWRSLWALWDAFWLQSQRWEDDMVQDLRYAFRMLFKYPAFTLVAVLTVALAIGANTAAFSLVNAVLLRPLPAAKDPQQLVMIQRGAGQSSPLSFFDYKILRDQNSSLNGLTLLTTSPMGFGNGSRSEVVLGALTTANYFDVLGVQPVLGRAFAPEEDVTPGGTAVAIVSYDFWQSRLNSDRSSVGKPIVLNGHQFTVIGVAPQGFAGTSVPVKICLWVPLMMYNEALRGGLAVRSEPLNDRDFERFDAIGRLKKDISLPQAEAELRLIGQQLEREHSLPTGRAASQQDRLLRLIQPRGIFLSGLKESSKVTSKLLLATVITLLLIACANVGNLLLARSTTRRREIAVRLALGATRTRILRQLLIESLVLSLLGGAAGLLVGYWFMRLLSALKPPFPPPFNFAIDLSLDLQSMGFAFLLALMSGLFFGLLPAMQSSNPRLIPALKDETGNGGMHFRWLNIRAILVMVQVALSVVLLIGAGLFLRSVNYAQQLDLGFRPERVLAASFNLRLQGYDEPTGRRFYEQLLRRLKTLPGVESASLANFLPLGFAGRAVNVTATEGGSDQNGTSAGYFAVGENYFETLGHRYCAGVISMSTTP